MRGDTMGNDTRIFTDGQPAVFNNGRIRRQLVDNYQEGNAGRNRWSESVQMT